MKCSQQVQCLTHSPLTHRNARKLRQVGYPAKRAEINSSITFQRVARVKRGTSGFTNLLYGLIVLLQNIVSPHA